MRSENHVVGKQVGDQWNKQKELEYTWSVFMMETGSGTVAQH